MKKSSLVVIESGNKIIAKKKVNIPVCLIGLIPLISGILLPIFFKELRSIPIFWIFLVLLTLGNIAHFVSLLFGKIVVDSSEKKIDIYNLCKESFRFDEVSELKSFFEPGDSEGGEDQNKLLFLFKNGLKREFFTTSKKQTDELLELLNSVIFSSN